MRWTGEAIQTPVCIYVCWEPCDFATTQWMIDTLWFFLVEDSLRGGGGGGGEVVDGPLCVAGGYCRVVCPCIHGCILAYRVHLVGCYACVDVVYDSSCWSYVKASTQVSRLTNAQGPANNQHVCQNYMSTWGFTRSKLI